MGAVAHLARHAPRCHREGVITVADLGEFGLIAALAARLAGRQAAIVGIGDDAAVVAAPDSRVVATVDLLIDGRHFRRDWSPPADIGAKAAARSLADVAAMGARPSALLVGLAAPGDLPVAWAEELVSGIADECARPGASVVGGDVSSADTVMLAVTALGDLGGRDPVTRSGARPGDLVAVAGVLGHSAAGLALLAAGRSAPAALVAAHRRPRPPYDAGLEAAALGATSMIDVSDGLVADMGHVADASGVAIDVRTDALSGDDALDAAAGALGAGASGGPGAGAAARWALTGGEDHALAATFPPGVALPPRWRVIGAVGQGYGVRVDGGDLGGRPGWDHFR